MKTDLLKNLLGDLRDASRDFPDTKCLLAFLTSCSKAPGVWEHHFFDGKKASSDIYSQGEGERICYAYIIGAESACNRFHTLLIKANLALPPIEAWIPNTVFRRGWSKGGNCNLLKGVFTELRDTSLVQTEQCEDEVTYAWLLDNPFSCSAFAIERLLDNSENVLAVAKNKPKRRGRKPLTMEVHKQRHIAFIKNKRNVSKTAKELNLDRKTVSNSVKIIEGVGVK